MQRVFIPVTILLECLGFLFACVVSIGPLNICINFLSIWTQPVSRVGWDPSKHSLLNTRAQTAVWGHFPAVVLWLIQREKQFLPTVVIFNTIVDHILAHRGISTACAAMQGSFNIHAALIWSLALAHEKHLRHIAGHAPIEALCCLLALIRLTLVRHAGLKNRR